MEEKKEEKKYIYFRGAFMFETAAGARNLDDTAFPGGRLQWHDLSAAIKALEGYIKHDYPGPSIVETRQAIAALDHLAALYRAFPTIDAAEEFINAEDKKMEGVKK